MACIVFVYLGLCFSVVHATQDCHGNDCPVTVNSMLQVKGQAQIEPKFGAGWYASGEWTTCIDACTNIGLTCTEAVVENQNYEIDTSAEVLELISSVGGSTSAGGCGLMQDSWTGCPSWTATWCCYSAANRSYTGACSKAPNADGKERLCYCHEAAATSEATTTSQYFTASENETCTQAGGSDVPEEDCKTACTSPAWTGYQAFGKGSWTNNPGCWQVVSGQYSGNCHWNNNEDAGAYSATGRAVCQATTTTTTTVWCRGVCAFVDQWSTSFPSGYGQFSPNVGNPFGHVHSNGYLQVQTQQQFRIEYEWKLSTGGQTDTARRRDGGRHLNFVNTEGGRYPGYYGGGPAGKGWASSYEPGKYTHYDEPDWEDTSLYGQTVHMLWERTRNPDDADQYRTCVTASNLDTGLELAGNGCGDWKEGNMSTGLWKMALHKDWARPSGVVRNVQFYFYA